ncbi:pyruvate kinase II [Vibrio nigripulchritudo SFn27]|uniref:Pyruvate kinase n=1 Tax=Vibrio nigripulchritudo TaxID=28173 RepID=U4KCZ7_9VIBR|nr:pyruvate kinase [Vibrio nigripulchritudo]CCN81492.1 pyruvate kinase II [Vibrio nigripulchritudo BLFn1]CCN91588.1 pyruvate kinase II [Vibrio nigripulchritudo SFn27]CCN96473.1 pyruvate kinase II [Vibrio nigripulchritudo ENn2]CCO38346.1 pyruvate kinase II [Vibrio nigripulchritudo SFn135]CCO53803.1 pyruvate kinase II [Vibrio nigripulchritudo Wn13]
MCKTKIVATLGPASQDEGVLSKMLDAGVNVVRLNFSHGTAQEHIEKANLVRKLAKQKGKTVGVLADLQGPKIRISTFSDSKVHLVQGQSFFLDASLGDQQGNAERVGLDYPDLIRDLEIGNILLLDDGRIQLKVQELDPDRSWVKTEVQNSGVLSGRKGINLLGGGLSAPALTEKDITDIDIAAAIQADFIAISFPRNGTDIDYARSLIRKAGSQADVVAKIERAETVASNESMDDIIAASDAIMVARGDLGVEIGDGRLPTIQKRLIKRARLTGKPVITATQMMESMIENPLPTRAEVLDVANAILDGSDAVMLSAESAAGKYPVESIEAMVRIAAGVEFDSGSSQEHWDELDSLCDNPNKSFAISSIISATKANRKLGVAILTGDGQTPRLMSRCQSDAQVWGLSSNEKVLGKMTLLRGVIPTHFNLAQQDDLLESVTQMLSDHTTQFDLESLLIAKLSSLEGQGEVNTCWMVNLGATDPIPA